MSLNQPLSGNAMPRFGGIASMMRLPVAASAQGLDAAFIGVPLDIGTSHRPGARFGPRQIRADSCLLRPYNMATGAAPFDALQVADLGDVPINTYSLLKSIDIITAYYAEVLVPGSYGAIPVPVLPTAQQTAWDAVLHRWETDLVIMQDPEPDSEAAWIALKPATGGGLPVMLHRLPYWPHPERKQRPNEPF